MLKWEVIETAPIRRRVYCGPLDPAIVQGLRSAQFQPFGRRYWFDGRVSAGNSDVILPNVTVEFRPVAEAHAHG